MILAVLAVSIPAAFIYAAVWLADTDLALHEQLALTGAVSFVHLIMASIAAAAAGDDW